MGSRAHVLLVSVSLSSFLTTGCIFGGKKKVPQAKAVAASTTPELDAQLDKRPTERLPRGARALKSDRDASALAELPKHSSTVTPPAATPPVAAPKDSGVEWPKPEELTLGTPGVPRMAPQSAPQQTQRVQPLAAQDDRVVIHDVETPGTSVAQQSTSATPDLTQAAAKASDDAVANRPLELQPDGGGGGGATAAGLAVNTNPQQQAHAAAQPQAAAPAAAALPAAATTDGVAGRVAQRLRENPGDLAANLDHQLLRFLMDEQVPDQSTLSTLPAEDREMLAALMDGLSNFRSGVRTDQNMLLSKKVRPLLDLAARLSSQADLTIPSIALCRKVSGFGTYEPMEARFVAGNRSEAIVYCEVGNVSSQQNQQGIWESRLTQEAVLYTEDGQRIWSNPPRAIVDKSRNRRRDFCVAQLLVLPPNLSINRYILKVTVKDEQAKRMAEAAMPIQIVAVLDAPAVPVAPATPPPLTNVPPAKQQQQQLQQQQQPIPSDLAQPAAQRGPGTFDARQPQQPPAPQLQPWPTQTADTK